jgi:hypothetical protein
MYLISNLQSFMGTDCYTDYCMVVSKVRGIVSASKQTARKFDVERFSLKKLGELEVQEQYQIKVSNKFTTLENLNDRMYVEVGFIIKCVYCVYHPVCLLCGVELKNVMIIFTVCFCWILETSLLQCP